MTDQNARLRNELRSPSALRLQAHNGGDRNRFRLPTRGLTMSGVLVCMIFFLLACVVASVEAPAAQRQAPEIRWCWSGAATDQSAVVVAAIDGLDRATLLLLDDRGRRVQLTDPAEADGHGVMRFELEGLRPLVRYEYRFGLGRRVVEGGHFTTMPAAGEPASFTFALGACNSARDNPTFRAIVHQDPLFFIHTGDMHYSDIATNRPDDFRRAMEQVLTDPAQASLYRSRAIAYMWDDHDYGPNDSRYNNPSRQAAHKVYRQVVPHYPLRLEAESEDRAAPIAQAFTVGRVRFVVPDLRSEHTREAGSLMGSRQREWFLEEIRSAAEDHVLIVFVSSVPWIAAQGRDHWGAAQEERRIIANFIKEHDIPICIIAGDAHMVAIDDGRNADYADGRGAPIPVFQAGALGRRGSYKGGPYSHGAHPGPNQFGIFRVNDDGRTVRVEWSARNGADGRGDTVVRANRDGEDLIEHAFEVPSRR
ncbi:MAG: alkaline phosphatase D family protein [Phycisphaeraceae bacterium]|nr:alkaline phosphatase D family protein [Phycisphaeraceae bacterium]